MQPAVFSVPFPPSAFVLFSLSLVLDFVLSRSVSTDLVGFPRKLYVVVFPPIPFSYHLFSNCGSSPLLPSLHFSLSLVFFQYMDEMRAKDPTGFSAMAVDVAKRYVKRVEVEETFSIAQVGSWFAFMPVFAHTHCFLLVTLAHPPPFFLSLSCGCIHVIALCVPAVFQPSFMQSGKQQQQLPGSSSSSTAPADASSASSSSAEIEEAKKFIYDVLRDPEAVAAVQKLAASSDSKASNDEHALTVETSPIAAGAAAAAARSQPKKIVYAPTAGAAGAAKQK